MDNQGFISVISSPATKITIYAPTPQNGQTHSNNSSGICQRIVRVCLTILWGCRLEG